LTHSSLGNLILISIYFHLSLTFFGKRWWLLKTCLVVNSKYHNKYALKNFSGSFQPFVLIRKKLVIFVHFKGFSISQKPKSNPLSYFAQKTSLNLEPNWYPIIFTDSTWWSSRTLTKLKSQSQKRFNEWKYQYLKYKNKNHSGPDT
jgi:hypothetical protein